MDGHSTPGIRALFHVTGGGIVGRMRYYCKHHHLCAKLHTLLSPPAEMCDIVDVGNVDIKEAYRTWNMGTGLIAICASGAADVVVNNARDHGLRAAVRGSIEAGSELELTYFTGVADRIVVT